MHLPLPRPRRHPRAPTELGHHERFHLEVEEGDVLLVDIHPGHCLALNRIVVSAMSTGNATAEMPTQSGAVRPTSVGSM